jgi:DeoR/GlpR family transcriptional regulator of sugar metabolism
MTTTARQQRILNLLRDNGSVRLRDLHLEFGVTSMTVWRDLRVLAEQGSDILTPLGGERLGAERR